MITKLSMQQQALFLGPVTNPYLLPIVAQFPTTPPGYTWTGTISAVAQNVVTSTDVNNPTAPFALWDPGNDLLSYIQWTLYRNGQAEQTWQGANMLCNVQSFGDSNDQLVISGVFPNTPTGVEPLAETVNVTVNFIGYQGLASEIPLVVPFVSMTEQNPFTQLIDPNTIYSRRLFQTSRVGVDTNQTMLTGPIPGTGFTGNALLASAFISLTNLAGASATSVIASLTDAGGVTYDSVCCLSGANMAQTESSAVELHLVTLVNFPLSLVFQTSGTGLNFTCSAGILWQPEVEVSPFVP